jgi:uncharacterized protein YqeY
MILEEKINNDIKEAMKSKDQARLRGVRAIKSAILLQKTSGSGQEMDKDTEIKMLQKLIKQRQDSYDIYIKQNRNDLADVEKGEIDVIMGYLPDQLSEKELEKRLKDLISQLGASTMKDMGRVMGAATKEFGGQADGKTISSIVKSLLS